MEEMRFWILIQEENSVVCRREYDGHTGWKKLHFETAGWENCEEKNTEHSVELEIQDVSRIIRANQYAVLLHTGQKDKAGIDYITHPARVAKRVEIAENDPDAVDKICTALLHDTMEDAGLTKEELESAFTEKTADAVELLTHKDGTPYPDYVRRAVQNPVARAVKKSDLKDNMDLSRIPRPTKKDHDRIRDKYIPAMEIVKEAEK